MENIRINRQILKEDLKKSMKNTLVKVWGIVLTVAILAGLLIVAVPVSAATTQYSIVNTPTAFTTAGTVDFLVAAKDGTTMFAYDNTALKFYKSTNGGVVFAPTSAPATTSNNLDGKVVLAMAVSPNYATDNTLIVATPGAVLLSTNGGATFFSAYGFVTANTITSVAITTGATGQTFAIGTSTGAFGGTMFMFDTGTFTWVDQATAGLPAGDVIGVAFSPNYAMDGQVLAITVGAGGAQVNNRIVNPGSIWNGTWGAKNWTVATAGLTNAYFAFGTDYASYSGSFVLGINGTANDDAYLITVSGPPTTAVTRLNISTIGGTAQDNAVASVSVKGTLSAGVYVGLVTGAVVKGTGIGGATATWAVPPVPQLGGGNAQVIAAAGGIYAGCIGGAFKSAVYMSADDTATFQPLSLIAVANPANLTVKNMQAVNTQTIFLMLTQAGIGDILFKTTDGGANWSAVYMNTTAMTLGVYVSPAYATDNTVYIPNNAPIQILKSTNGGATFIPQVVGNPGSAITAFAAMDGTTYYAGYLNFIYKSNRFIQAANLTLAPLSLNVNVTSLTLAGAVIFAGTSNGSVLMSTDDAVSFSFVGGPAALGGGNVIVVADPVYAATKTIYASTSAGAGVSAFTVGVSPAWGPASGALAINSISLDPGGNLYAGQNALSILRILNPAGPPPVTAVDTIGAGLKTATTNFGLATTISQVAALDDGDNVTLLAVANIPAVVPVPYGFRIVSFTDNCINAPTGIKINPVSGTATGQTVISWNAYSAVFVPGPVMYQYEIAYDSTFAPASIYIAATAVNAPIVRLNGAFAPGTTYYVRVRVQAAQPLVSNWSNGIQFSTPLTEPGNDLTQVGNIAPAAGTIITNTKTPTFTWAQVAGAISYNVQIFTTSDLSGTPLVDATGLTATVYTSAKALDPGTYYWQVRAVAGDIKGSWVQSSFSIANPPTATATGGTSTITIPPITIPTITVPPVTVPPATVTVSVPTPTVTVVPGETSTPAWTWVLIVIGAVLVIAVIVLIVRTRRV